jgi:hypothetical protein
MMRLQTTRAIYKDGGLVFIDPKLAPENGAEVVVTFLKRPPRRGDIDIDPIQALRGRGRGEGLVDKLLQSRNEDQEKDEQSCVRLRT